MAKILFQKTHPIIKKWAVPEIFGTGRIAKAVKDRSKLADTMFKMPLSCTNPVFASVYRGEFENSPGLSNKRFYLNCDDGGIIAIDKMIRRIGNPVNEDKPLVLIFPGATETTYSTKMQTLCAAYLNAGYDDVFICNYRGRCHTPLKTPQFSFPVERLNDVHSIVDRVINLYPGRKILLSGNCHGGQFIVDYLTVGQMLYPVARQIVGGVVHSVLWDSHDTVFRGRNYIRYSKPWAKRVKSQLLKGQQQSETFRERMMEKLGDHLIGWLSTVSMDDPNDIALLFERVINNLTDGTISNQKDYQRKASPACKIGNTARPLIVINAADDPTAPISFEDIEEIKEDKNICLWLFASGGHCAYVKHLFPTATNFIDEVMIECSDIVVNVV